MPRKKKRIYTFRKGQIIPYESGSPMHQMVKAEKEAAKGIARALDTSKRQK
jgi:hypothetical protein